ncbi:HEPN domain-containing protein [Paraburkholderia nodosa]|uniref:HEPN domain-containing protein n=1 Tax=Paraburkholderia nodosa TaxID=392320 RepID=UPI00047FE951|nr:HEPN domain-containing protein [Paraburkholderia nodosa]
MYVPTEVDRLYEESSGLINFLSPTSEISFQSMAGDNFRKVLLLAAASFFEYRICEIVTEFFRIRSNNSTMVVNFLRNKAISRQYHSWFDWDNSTNANKFFALFGDEFKASIVTRVRETPDLKLAIEAFMEIGRERNKLVHQNFATFSMEKSLSEIFERYKQARHFIDVLPTILAGSAH